MTSRTGSASLSLTLYIAPVTILAIWYELLFLVYFMKDMLQFGQFNILGHDPWHSSFSNALLDSWPLIKSTQSTQPSPPPQVFEIHVGYFHASYLSLIWIIHCKFGKSLSQLPGRESPEPSLLLALKGLVDPRRYVLYCVWLTIATRRYDTGMPNDFYKNSMIIYAVVP